VYEDLGIHSDSVLDPSFNVNNFYCLDIPEGHPDRPLAFECALSGTVGFLNEEQKDQASSSRQSIHSVPPTLSSSGSSSPTSLDSQGRTRTTSKQQKEYWLRENTGPMVSLNAQCSAAGESVNECAKVGLRSFSPLDEQTCPGREDFSMPAIQERTINKAGDVVSDAENFEFPSWDQLPEHLQNPTTSEGFCSTIPIGSTGVSMPSFESTVGNNMAWDNEEMNFAMDLDLDMDLDMNDFGMN
jgi:hypothetical protein